jgi:uncharacterized protein YggE
MKTLFAVLGLTCVFSAGLLAQTQSVSDRRMIEVTGSAERWITPDEFTFKITLLERIEKDKQKITIEMQETLLRNELAALGVDVAKDLSVFDISSTYFRQKKVRDVLGTKDYRLKLRDLDKIARLQEIADRLNVSRLDLIDTDHSELTRLRRETKIDAIRAAKEKADYLLGSIGQRAGKPILIREEDEDSNSSANSNISSNRQSNAISYGVIGPSAADTLAFSQIRLRFEITARFEIE